MLRLTAESQQSGVVRRQNSHISQHRDRPRELFEVEKLRIRDLAVLLGPCSLQNETSKLRIDRE